MGTPSPLTEFSNKELADELINRGGTKRLPILIVFETDDGDLEYNASHRTACFGLASWFLEDVKLGWADRD